MSTVVGVPEEFDPTEYVYVQVANRIAARIASDEIKIGDRLPPEYDLADEYGVARMTARRAIEVLRDRGLVRTLQGRGTFVIAKPLDA